MTDEPITQHELDAFRAAVAMAIHGHRGDAEAVATVLEHADHQPSVIYALAKLVPDVARGAAARHGEDFPIEQALQDLLLNVTTPDDDPEEG